LIPVSAPVTPRALDSPPPEPAIEATPENTPVSTPNKVKKKVLVFFRTLLAVSSLAKQWSITMLLE
jgi:hypothetical protein